MDNNGTLEIVEENNYYPFGLKHKGYNNVVSQLGNSVAQRWKFGGKELSEELGLNTYDFGARNYDPALGRWMNLDPHAESYFSVTPYSSFANNPLSFIDPNGEDILFWQWDSVDKKYVQVGYDELDEATQQAVQDFLKTDSGKDFLSMFANKGDKLGDFEFTEDGKYAKHNYNLAEVESGGEGSTPYPIPNEVSGPTEKGGGTLNYIDFWTKYNTKKSDNSRENNVETIGHEVFLHLMQDLDYYVSLIETGGAKAVNNYTQRKKETNHEGYREHFAVGGKGNQTYLADRYNTFISQLKQVLNPVRVNRLVNESRKKNVRAATRSLQESRKMYKN